MFQWLIQSCTCSIVFQRPAFQNKQQQQKQNKHTQTHTQHTQNQTKTRQTKNKQISDTNFVSPQIPYPLGWDCPEVLTSSHSINNALPTHAFLCFKK